MQSENVIVLNNKNIANSKKNVPTLEDAREYIKNLDFSTVINKMVQYQGWLESDAIKICKMYKNYLYLKKKYGQTYPLPPSEEIDEFWHNHILDTKKYREDCKKIFGKYLDHYPYFGIDKETNAEFARQEFIRMQKLYYEEFSEILYEVKTLYSKLVFFIKKWAGYKSERISITI